MLALPKKLEKHAASLQHTILGYSIIRAQLASPFGVRLTEDLRSKPTSYYDGIIFQAEQSLHTLLMAYGCYDGFSSRRCKDPLSGAEYSFNHCYGDLRSLIEEAGQLLIWERS